MDSTLTVRHTPRLRVFERHVARGVGVVDIGIEAPIEVDGKPHPESERRHVPWRWFGGAVITALAGASLLSAAIYAAFDRQTNFAEAPEAAAPLHRDTADESVNPRKADRIVKAVDIVAARQTFRAPTTVNVGDKEIVRVRGFTRVAAPMVLSSAGYADDVPPFDPLKVISDAGGPVGESPEAIPPQDDAEVSFSTHEIGDADIPDSGVALSRDEIQAQISEHLKNAIAAGSSQPLPMSSQILLMRTSHAGVGPAGGLGYAPLSGGLVASPFSSIEVRMVPENVTAIPRTSAASVDNERLVVVRHGETLEDILRAQGASRDQIRSIAAAIGTRRGPGGVVEGQRLKFLMTDADGGDATRAIAKLSIYTDDKLETAVALSDSGSYARAEDAPRSTSPAKARPASDDDDDDGAMRLYDSFYESALKNDLPRTVISELVRIFANDVDFQRGVTGGDSFEVFYTEPDEADGPHELLYASITARNETFRYYRYQTTDDGQIDFYDETGKSSRKFLIRQPIANARITSPFGSRFHPILGYTRMHTGVDFAAPIGTPIIAAGNGTIIKAGRESGYGNRVEIQHANGYITTYNHMTGFARGVVPGVKVRQGQVIGYLGMTGLATGPHLHYEVIINGNFVDPMRVKLARTRELDGRAMAAFKRERDRIDGLIAKTPGLTRLASGQPITR